MILSCSSNRSSDSASHNPKFPTALAHCALVGGRSSDCISSCRTRSHLRNEGSFNSKRSHVVVVATRGRCPCGGRGHVAGDGTSISAARRRQRASEYGAGAAAAHTGEWACTARSPQKLLHRRREPHLFVIVKEVARPNRRQIPSHRLVAHRSIALPPK